MPRTKRDKLKRECANAISYLFDAMYWTERLYDTFKPVHPEYGDYLAAIETAILQCNEMLHDFWRKTWGDNEVNWSAYSTVRSVASSPGRKEIYAPNRGK